MCGIVGIFNFKTGKSVEPEQLDLLSRCLVHRGPDDQGIYLDGPLGLGMRRLSVIDIETGRQPVHNETECIWVVFNGEIYNFKELTSELLAQGHSFYTHTDTEVLVHLYEQDPERFVERLNGMYAFALWDRINKTLLLARDPVGIKPLFVAETEDGVIFASEIKALLPHLKHVHEDPSALRAYLTTGYIPSPMTGFREIKKLEAGTIHSYCLREPRSRQQPIKIRDGSEDLLGRSNEFLDIFKDVIRRQLTSDVPVGLLLSGGIDSSLIAAVCAKEIGSKPTCFSVGFTDSSYDESKIAEETAKYLSLHIETVRLSPVQVKNEIETILGWLDEPLMDYSYIPTYFVTKFARGHVKVLLSGDGSDELFGGYPTHYLPRIANMYAKLPSFIRRSIGTVVHAIPASSSYLSFDYKLKRFCDGATSNLLESHLGWKRLLVAEQIDQIIGPASSDGNPDDSLRMLFQSYIDQSRSLGKSLEEQVMHLDFKTFLQDDCLQKVDRMSMANSIEVRVPYLDNKLVSFAQRLPIQNKLGLFSSKRILRAELNKLVPTGIASRKKQGFTPPLGSWINKELKDFVHSTLTANFPSGPARPMIERLLQRHHEGREENSRALWALVGLATWRKNYARALS